MEFNSFQNDSAILKRIALDFGGNPSVQQSITVKCDVQFQVKRTTNNDGEEIVTVATAFVTPQPSLTALDTNKQWQFEYDGQTYQVERYRRVRFPASPAVSHYELDLR
jgi:hypothetical protein